MEKSPKHYWAVYEGKEVVFSGSFNECWEHLGERYADEKVSALFEDGIRIARSN